MFGCLPIGPRSHSLKQRGAGRLLFSQYTLCSQYSRRKLFALTLENFCVQIFMKLCVQHAYCTCSLLILIFVNIHGKQYSFSFFFPWVVLLQLAVVLWCGGVEWKPDSVKYQLTSFFLLSLACQIIYTSPLYPTLTHNTKYTRACSCSFSWFLPLLRSFHLSLLDEDMYLHVFSLDVKLQIRNFLL